LRGEFAAREGKGIVRSVLVRRGGIALGLAVACVSLAACQRKPAIEWDKPDLLLAQAQFKEEEGTDGKKRQVPGAARLLRA